MSIETETTASSTLFDKTRYVLLAVIAIALIYYALKPPGAETDTSDKVADNGVSSSETADSVITCRGTTMGSVPYCVKVRNVRNDDNTDNITEKALTQFVQNALDRVDFAMSTYRNDSEVSRFNASESLDWFSVSRETAHVVQIAQEISELTQGTFDITVGPLVDRWGFGPEKQTVPPTQEEIEQILSSVGYQRLSVRLDPPTLKKEVPTLRIDLSGIAKGFAVDQIAETLEKQRFQNYMIEVGGETRTKGEKSPGQQWVIGIEIPVPQWWGEPKIQRLAHLGSKSMATSGDYQNFVDYKGIRFSHIIDPRTGWPTEKEEIEAPHLQTRLGSLSVVDSSCVRADALTKGFYILGIEKGLKLANEQGIAVLFLLREEKPEKRGPGPRFTIKEIMSDAFKQKVNSWTVD